MLHDVRLRRRYISIAQGLAAKAGPGSVDAQYAKTLQVIEAAVKLYRTWLNRGESDRAAVDVFRKGWQSLEVCPRTCQAS